jgi:cardiolipin synthase
VSAQAYISGFFGPLEGRPTIPSKLNTLVQLAFVIAVVWQAAFQDLPGWLIQGLGALVLVTTAVSGVDYVLTYIRKAVAVSRARRGTA